MPAQIFVTHRQLEKMVEQGHDVVICEGPRQAGANDLDVWILDEDSMQSDRHRSLVIDPDGNPIGDIRLGDSD